MTPPSTCIETHLYLGIQYLWLLFPCDTECCNRAQPQCELQVVHKLHPAIDAWPLKLHNSPLQCKSIGVEHAETSVFYKAPLIRPLLHVTCTKENRSGSRAEADPADPAIVTFRSRTVSNDKLDGKCKNFTRTLHACIHEYTAAGSEVPQ